MQMKKIFVFSVTAILFGLVIAGSGITMAIEPNQIVRGSQLNYISFSSAGNTSFLTPSSINYTMNPIFSPWYFHSLIASEIMGIDDYFYIH